MAEMMNYVAIFLAALANMTVGMLWYGPLFGKKWMGLMGFSMKSMKKMKLTPTAAMTMGFVTSILTASVLYYFMSVFGLSAERDAALFGFLVWAGIMAPLQFGSFLWEGKDIKLFLLNTSASLISVLAMVLVLSIWV